MWPPVDFKDTLKHYLQEGRDALLWKAEGLSERDLRLPRTPTGLTLAGLVLHCANVEIGYFGDTFGRPWPTPDEPCAIAMSAYDTDPQADWTLPAEVSSAELFDFYRRVWAFADRTIADLELDAAGAPPWWGDPVDNQVTLLHMLVRVIDDTARHAGQADLVREAIDGAVGLSATNPSIASDVDWAAHRARLTAIAERFPDAR